MTPQELKASILQLAIQGKLVPQLPEEGTGEELYHQIQVEKQRLIKAGKIKKEKPLPEITEDEIPFDLPESWKWVRLGDCSGYSQTKEKIASTDITGDMWSLDLEDIQKETGAIVAQTTASARKITGDKVRFYRGQVLYSKLRPYLKKILVAPADGICTPELVPFDTYLVDANYLVCVLKSPHIDFVVNSVTYGVKMPRVGTDTMVNLLIPLPPLAEQKRIVAKIEELLPRIDRYDQAWSKLEDFNKRFPVDMQKSILQMAIQGKLVPQLPEEGTGEELYQQIQAEKQALIKAGKIKKEKPLPEITDDEIPFDIPESWRWVRWGEIVNIVSARRVHQSDWKNEGVPFYRAREIAKLATDGWVDNDLFISQKLYDNFSKSGVPKAGDLMVTAVGTLGKTYIVKETDHFYYKDASVICFENYAQVSSKYLKYMMESELMKNQIKSNSGGTTVGTLTMVRMIEYLMPLPPLAEQKRIVAKLEEILPLCERLK